MATGRAASRARRAKSKSRSSSSKSSSSSSSSSSSKSPYERAKALGYGDGSSSGSRNIPVSGSGSGLSASQAASERAAQNTRFGISPSESVNYVPTTRKSDGSYSRGKAITPADFEKARVFEANAQAVPESVDFTANNKGLIGGESGFITDGNFLVGGETGTEDKYAGLEQNQRFYQDQLSQYMEDRTTGADIQRDLERETGIKELRQKEADLSAQLNTITANRDAAQLGLEGQGRGITDTIIGGQQARIGREAAIQALPVQAQLAAAQGNVALAEAHINTWGTIMMQDAATDFNFKKELLTSSKDFANSIQLAKIADLDKANDRKYQEQQDLISAKTQAMSNALGQGAPSSVSIAIQNATNPTEVAEALGKYNADLLAREAQQASINASRVSTALNQQQLNDIKTKNAQIQAAVDSGAIIMDENQREDAYKLSKDFETESSTFKDQVGAYNRIIASAEDPSAAGDLALIFNYMKMLDPGSVVREGEFANAENSGGVPQKIRNQYNKIMTGERLPQEIRNDFVDRSTRLYGTALDQQVQLEDRFKDKAVNIMGLPDGAGDLIIQDIRAAGAVSDVVFGIQLNRTSEEQLQALMDEGLIPRN